MTGAGVSRSVLSGLAAAVLVLGAACSSTPTAPSPPPAPSVPTTSPASPAAPAAPADDAAPEVEPLAFGATHAFPDGNTVTVAAPVAGPAVPGTPFPRSVEVTVTVRNGTPAPEDLGRFGFDATVPGEPEDREAPATGEGPDGILAPGEARTFPVRFALPDPGPTEVTVEVSKTDQTPAGEDVPGSDEVPGAFVDFAGPV
ncbi:hypothetical protein [Actinomycetospora straminea]|uniref:DUF4352 domain-containing protein n=1 Tax=Actinomycetospora straminea TaxID=663607 RepID=A0ABP9DWA0_9PSEU|nr:hypothetical protein [Actinomycetospora straminea]MDD7935260.1 hypothetical protein [Actinomycetospora straminea]